MQDVSFTLFFILMSDQTFDALTSEFRTYLEQIHRKERTIARYVQLWGRISIFMDSHKILFYDKKIGEAYLYYLLGDFIYSKISKYHQEIVNRVESLSEFQDCGTILMGRRRKPPVTLNGPIGATMENYITHKKSTHQICNITSNYYRFYLYDFLLFLNNHHFTATDQIAPADILLFVDTIRFKNLATKHVVLFIIKGYLRHLYHNRLTQTDLSMAVPKDNYKSQTHLPSTFSKEEIKILIESIDRGNSRGRRDYAILLLATKLGLRASDLAGLKFEHILWEQHKITFQQMKTKRSIILPLLPEIGNAIVDYLQNGRPHSEDSHCFLQLIPPYRPIDKSSIGNIVKYHLSRSGINCKDRKHGPHALRHSLAGSLLNNKTPIPVISEVLGHSSSETTMYYLRIDISKLKQCALDVPTMTSSFYDWKGELSHV